MPAPNWQRAYQLQLADAIEHYQRLRSGPPCGLHVEVPGQPFTKSVHDLTDTELTAVAQHEAEGDIQRAIHTLKTLQSQLTS